MSEKEKSFKYGREFEGFFFKGKRERDDKVVKIHFPLCSSSSHTSSDVFSISREMLHRKLSQALLPKKLVWLLLCLV